MPRASKLKGEQAPKSEKGKALAADSSPDSGAVPAPEDAVASPFGAPLFTSETPKDKLVAKGIKIEMAVGQTLPTDQGYVHPEERMNPDYHKKAVEAHEKQVADMKASMGIGTGIKTLHPSPNSPIGTQKIVW